MSVISNRMYITKPWNVLVETKLSVIWYDFWCSCQIWHFLILLNFVTLCCLTLTSKTPSLKHDSDKVPRAKLPHGTYSNIMILSKSGLSIGFATKILIFTPPPLLCFLCLINSFYRRYVSCVYIIYSIDPIYCLIISYYRELLCSISVYFVLFRFILLYFALFRQSLVPQKGPHGIHVSHWTRKHNQKLQQTIKHMFKNEWTQDIDSTGGPPPSIVKAVKTILWDLNS